MQFLYDSAAQIDDTLSSASLVISACPKFVVRAMFLCKDGVSFYDCTVGEIYSWLLELPVLWRIVIALVMCLQVYMMATTTRRDIKTKEVKPSAVFTSLRRAISPDVLEYLSGCDICNCPEESLESMTFNRCVDHKGVEGHVYYEGYHHATTCNIPLRTVYPRRCTESMMRQPAGEELRRFMQAFRTVNARVFDDLRVNLQRHDRNTKCTASRVFARCIAEDRHFADCSTQIHFGTAVPEKHIKWHVDAPNSALHMGLSLRGDRIFHDRIGSAPSAQTVGDVYVGCPATFRHGVEYTESTWDTRMIAVQSRILLNPEEMKITEFGPDNDFERCMCEVIVPHMKENGDRIVMPSMADIRTVELPSAPATVWFRESALDKCRSANATNCSILERSNMQSPSSLPATLLATLRHSNAQLFTILTDPDEHREIIVKGREAASQLLEAVSLPRMMRAMFSVIAPYLDEIVGYDGIHAFRPVPYTPEHSQRDSVEAIQQLLAESGESHDEWNMRFYVDTIRDIHRDGICEISDSMVIDIARAVTVFRLCDVCGNDNAAILIHEGI